MNNNFLILTGGTGGHVFPSVSFGNYLIDNNYQCTLITDSRGKKYTKNFIGKIKVIQASHLTGGFFFQIKGLIMLTIGFFQSFFLIAKLQPKFVLSFGSYASLTPSFAIIILKFFFKINFYIHEQNSILGKSNNYFIKNTNKIFVNFNKNYNLSKKNSKKICVVGLPKTTHKKNNNLENNLLEKIKNKHLILLYGGSQGSIDILSCLEKLLSKLTSKEILNIFFIIQCPYEYNKTLLNKIKKFKINYEINDYFTNLDALLIKADLIISRAGAGTIDDIIRNQVPSILIPLPGAKDNHQYENAKILSDKECGIILDQNKFDSNKCLNFVKQILKDRNRSNKIKEKFNQYTVHNSNKLMLDIIKNEIS